MTIRMTSGIGPLGCWSRWRSPDELLVAVHPHGHGRFRVDWCSTKVQVRIVLLGRTVWLFTADGGAQQQVGVAGAELLGDEGARLELKCSRSRPSRTVAGRNERSTDPASSGLLSTARISASCGWICFGPRYPCTERSHLRYRGTETQTRELWITPGGLAGLWKTLPRRRGPSR